MIEFATWREGLARLSELVELAQQLAWKLRTDEHASAEARALYGRLEEIRLEIETLGRTAAPSADSACTELLQKLGFPGLIRDDPA